MLNKGVYLGTIQRIEIDLVLVLYIHHLEREIPLCATAKYASIRQVLYYLHLFAPSPTLGTFFDNASAQTGLDKP